MRESTNCQKLLKEELSKQLDQAKDQTQSISKLLEVCKRTEELVNEKEKLYTELTLKIETCEKLKVELENKLQENNYLHDLNRKMSDQIEKFSNLLKISPPE